MSKAATHLVFVTRPSLLARQQTRWVMQALQSIDPSLSCEEKMISTRGDRNLNQPLPEIGGKGLFTEELQSELLSGGADCAVHSLKDLPVDVAEGLTIACIPPRADPREVLVSARGYTFDALPFEARVGTSSLRRAAQVLARRPDLRIDTLRGNVDTRLRKALDGQYDAILLAGAGISRLGLERYVTQWLSLEVMLPAPGQGALAVQCRADDEPTCTLLAMLDHQPTRQAVTAERQFLLGLGGGCSAPIAAYAICSESLTSEVHLKGRVISLDGKKVLNVSGDDEDATRLGLNLAKEILALGAAEILFEVAEK